MLISSIVDVNVLRWNYQATFCKHLQTLVNGFYFNPKTRSLRTVSQGEIYIREITRASSYSHRPLSYAD